MIKKLSKKHYNDVIKLANEFSVASPYSDMQVDADDLYQTLEVCRQYGLSFVYEVDGKAVGVILAVVSPMWFNQYIKAAMELMWWITPEYRGHGWSLKDAYEKAAIEKGISHIGLATLNTSNITEKLLKDGYVSKETAWVKEV